MTPTFLRRSAALAAVVVCTALALTGCGDDDDTSDTTAAATSASAAETAAATTAVEPAEASTASETAAASTAAETAEATTAAETAPATTSDTRTVEADNGTFEIPADPQRVVTIGNTAQPFVDLGGKPVGASPYYALDLLPEDQQATFAAAADLGEEEVDLEQVASLEPDLILVQMDDAGFEQIEKQLQAIAPTLFWGLDTEWKQFADAIAEAGNLTEGLSAQKAEFDAHVTGIKEKYGELIASTSFVDVSRGDWSDPGTFFIADIGCSEIGRDDVGLNLPQADEGADPLAYANLSFEQLSSLAKYDVITYPVDDEGKPTEPFVPVLETNTWKALPAVKAGRALGVFCPGNGSYGQVNRYLDSLDDALATLSS